jgi:flagellar biosynthesis protein FlhF
VPTYARLVDSDMPEALARDLVRSVAKRLAPSELRRSDLVLDALRLALSSRVQVAPALTSLPGTRQAVALVGPTGVGKTTTLAKLAARLQLDQKIRPGLITIDTYRAAAIEQLNTYARILGLPFAVAHEPDEMRQALDSLGDVDIALIDTAGGGPRDEPRIHELAEFLESARPREIHLVLSASADERSRHWAVDRFAKLRADRLILSKLDEASTFGSLAGVMTRSDLPISYLTTGQSVPDDLEAADPMLLARLVLPADSITAEAGPRSGSARPLTPMSRMHVFTSAITGQHSQDRGQL